MALSAETLRLWDAYRKSREWSDTRTYWDTRLTKVAITPAEALRMRREGYGKLISGTDDAPETIREIRNNPKYITDYRVSYTPRDVIALLTENNVAETVHLLRRKGERHHTVIAAADALQGVEPESYADAYPHYDYIVLAADDELANFSADQWTTVDTYTPAGG